ncbi:MAG: GAF domain-containing protein [Longimicrobiaceae bacterium]
MPDRAPPKDFSSSAISEPDTSADAGFEVAERVFRAISAPDPRQGLLAAVLDETSRLVHAAHTAVFSQHGPGAGALRSRGGTGRLGPAAQQDVPVAESFAGWAYSAAEAQQSRDLRFDPRAHPELERELGLGPAAALPLILSDRVSGVLVAARDPGRPLFRADELRLLAQLARLTASALEGVERLLGPEPGQRTSPSPEVLELMRAVRHEVNNPLAVIMGQAQLLRSHPPVAEDETIEQAVVDIYEEGSRIRDSIRRLTREDESVLKNLDLDQAKLPFEGR